MYRYITSCARHSSFSANCDGCLKVLNISTLQSIRKFNLKEKNECPLKDDDESKLTKFKNELYLCWLICGKRDRSLTCMIQFIGFI